MDTCIYVFTLLFCLKITFIFHQTPSTTFFGGKLEKRKKKGFNFPFSDFSPTFTPILSSSVGQISTLIQNRTLY